MRGLAGVGIAAGIVAGLLGLFWLAQRRLIYFPFDPHVPPAGEVLRGAEDGSIRTPDGLRLGAWWVPARAADPSGVVIVLNGNAGNRFHRAPLAAALAERGYASLLFDYRGYGGNPGSPTEEGLYLDALGARSWVDDRVHSQDVPIFYFGESLGAAVAIDLATRRPPDGLVLRSPFTSLADVGRIHYPFLPVRALLRDRYESAERIVLLSCPVLVVAGDNDSIIPPDQSRRLHDLVRGHRRFVLLRGVDHNDFGLLAGDELMREVTGFLEQAVSGCSNGFP